MFDNLCQTIYVDIKITHSKTRFNSHNKKNHFLMLLLVYFQSCHTTCII